MFFKILNFIKIVKLMDSNDSFYMSAKFLNIALNIYKYIFKEVFYIRFILQFPGLKLINSFQKLIHFLILAKMIIFKIKP